MVELPFRDRKEAGRLLGEKLALMPGLVRPRVVLALPRGGVPVGAAVARALACPLGVVIARKLGVPGQPELAMGAIAGESSFLDEALVRYLGISADEVEAVIAREAMECSRRTAVYMEGQPELDWAGQTAVLVDDGIATGSTMIAAARHVRHRGAKGLVIAVPVAPVKARERMAAEADEFVTLATPEPFISVGMWYADFGQVSDARVRRILSSSAW